MDADYDLKAWDEETTLGRRVFNYNYRMLGYEVKAWAMVKAVPMQKAKGITEVAYLWQSQGAAHEMVRVNVAELPDWRAAQEHLLDRVNRCMRPNIPRGTGKVASVGDVNLVARDLRSDFIAAIQFTRGNVAVVINSIGQVNIDVSEIAASVDRSISESPSKQPSLRTLAKRQTPNTVVIKAKESATLVKSIKKVSEGNTWLKVIVPDGEVVRKGDALLYSSPKPGKKTVQIFAIRSRAK